MHVKIVLFAASLMSLAAALPYTGNPIYGRDDAGSTIPIGSPDGLYISAASPDGGHVWEYHGVVNTTDLTPRDENIDARTNQKRAVSSSQHCDGFLNNESDEGNAEANLFSTLLKNPVWDFKIAYIYGTATAYGCNYDGAITWAHPFSSIQFTSSYGSVKTCPNGRLSAGWVRWTTTTFGTYKYAVAYGVTSTGIGFC